MIDLLPIPLFPEGALASSVVTTVLVGVFVVCLFNLRFGWVLSGLVVPGYMVPLLLDNPVAASVVFTEGVLTYGLVWFYSEFLSRHIGWSNFFGRDRFFALVLVSVGVRVVLDGWLLPIFGEWVNTRYQLTFDYRNNLHSFGLIVVSLIANNFWKTGLRRGVLPMVVTVGLTYLVVRYVLVEFTNFNVNSLSFVYEDIAASLMASPKAYIILLTTAFIASRMNLLYGWDFAGILIPSLLALQWYQPEKILSSFVEAFVILFVARAVLQLPLFRGQTIEGARKLMLFFTVSYAYKYLLAYLILWLAPEEKITDYYGFGYLLPTLLAIKMHDLGVVSRMVRATLQTSLVSGLLATLVGFALYFIPDSWTLRAATTGMVAEVREDTGSLVSQVSQQQVALYNTRQLNSMAPALGGELDTFRAALRLLRDRPANDVDALRQASALLADVHYDLLRVDQRYLILQERMPQRNWGMYVIDPLARGALLVEVPAPLDERGTMDAGLGLFRHLGARALAFSGAARQANKDGSADALLNPRTPFLVFHQVFAAQDVLQVRAYTIESRRVLSGRRPGRDDDLLDDPPTQLWVKRQLPASMDLGELQSVVGKLDLRWGSSPLPNVPRETVQGGFAELVLDSDRMRTLIANTLHEADPVLLADQDISIEGYLQDLLLRGPAMIAKEGSNAYRQPAMADLLFLDGEVVEPMLRASAQHYQGGHWTETGLTELRLIQSRAAAFGYVLIRYRHRATGNDYLVLRERDEPTVRRHWGTYVIRLGEATPLVIQVPRPGYEINSLEAAVSLFDTTRAQFLLVGGAHPLANQDLSADLLRFHFRSNFFNTVNQAVLRELGDRSALVVQVRTMGLRRDVPPVSTDVIIAAANGAQTLEQLGKEGQHFHRRLKEMDLSVGFAGGSPESAGLEAATLPQAAYLAATQNKEFFALWVTPLARNSYRQQTEPSPQEQQFRALGIPSQEVDLFAYVEQRSLSPGLPPGVIERLAPYFDTQDIVVLSGVRRQYSQLRFERVVDLNSRQGFLAIRAADGALLALVNPLARKETQPVALPASGRRAAVVEFVDRRAAWLLPLVEDAR